MRATRYAYCLP